MSATSVQTITADIQKTWLALLLLCLPTAVLALDMSVLYLALPHIASSFNTSSVQELWILDVYPLMIAGFLVPMGGMCDKWGNRRILLIGATAFVILSLVASIASSALILIATRATLGIAGATLMPATLGLIRELFQDPHKRRLAISIWTSAFMGGFALGPIIGGILLEYFHWGAIFLMAIPVMLPLLLAGPIVFDKKSTPENQKKYDWFSSIMFLTSVIPLVHGLKTLISDTNKFVAVIFLLWGIFAGSVFVLRQLKSSNPLIDFKLILSNSAMATALMILLLGPAIVGGLTLFVPQYLQLSYGYSAVQAGVSVAPASLALIVGALISPKLSEKLKSCGIVIGMGFLVMQIGLITVISGVHLGPTWVLVGLALVYFGCGPFDALATDIVISSAPENKSASAGAAVETATDLGIGIGIAIFGTLGTIVYQRILSDRLINSNIESNIVERVTSSFSVVMTEAYSLGSEEGRFLQEQASEAFASGLEAVAGSTIVLAIFLSALSFTFLRKTA